MSDDALREQIEAVERDLASFAMTSPHCAGNHTLVRTLCGFATRLGLLRRSEPQPGLDEDEPLSEDERRFRIRSVDAYLARRLEPADTADLNATLTGPAPVMISAWNDGYFTARQYRAGPQPAPTEGER